jgi:membrane-associated protease RseP (regulator of RpoE activity)
MRPPRIAVVVLAMAAVAGCGQTSGVASASSAGESDAAQRLTSLTSLDERVARVAYRLSQANVALCPTVRQSAGWALHSARQYSLELRPHAESRFGLDGDLPGVLVAPPGSPAEKAGLRQGDVILKVGEVDLAVGDGRPTPQFEGLARNVAVVDAALARGPTTFTVRRDGAVIPAMVTPERACGYEVQLNPSDELNARADGRRLFISTALAGFAQSDDELAVILGHELAHHVLGHRTWSDVGGVGRTSNAVEVAEGEGGKERQADRVGLYLLARAGYDPAVAAPFWRRFGASNWRVRYPQLEHASAGSRAQRLEAVQGEIAAKQAAGQPLTP